MKRIHFEAKVTVLLLAITIIAAILRIWNLAHFPLSLYWDEAAIGYNAYSIAETGKDEFGKSFPVLFRSFDDYKSGAIIYIIALFLKFLPLSEFSIRFPNALFGTLTVTLFYFFVHYALTYFKIHLRNIKIIALCGALLLALSPWHILLSRAAFEANIGFFFVVLGFTLFFASSNYSFLKYISAIVLGLSMYCYRSIHIFVPLTFIFLILTGIQFSRKALLQSIFVFILFLCVSAPVVNEILSPQGLVRYRQTNIFSQSESVFQEQANNILKSGNTTIAKVIYNRRLVYIRLVISHVIFELNPLYYFYKSGISDRGHIADIGLFYLFELIFFIIGYISLFLKSKKLSFVITAWIIFAVLPAALTVPSNHSLRSENVIAGIYLCIAVGIGVVSRAFFSKPLLYRIGVFALSVILTLSLYNFLSLYYRSWAYATADVWANGYKQLVEAVSKKESNYETITITGHYWKPYTHFAIYKKFPPAAFQLKGNSWGFEKYAFGGTGWGGEKELDQIDTATLKENKSLVVFSDIEYSRLDNKEVFCKVDELQPSNSSMRFIFTSFCMVK